MLNDRDVERLDEMFGRVFEKREQRGYIPNRDEDKIAEILQRGDDAARRQHELLVESDHGFGSPVRDRSKASDIEDAKDFTSLTKWKHREIEED